MMLSKVCFVKGQRGFRDRTLFWVILNVDNC